MPRPVTVRLVARCSASPPPQVAGPLSVRLAATMRHAAACTWEDLHRVTADRWLRGRGPMGPKLGLVFYDRTTQWLPHDAPGEISPTAGLVWSDLGVWLTALHAAMVDGDARFSIQEQDFQLAIDTRHARIRAIDWDGVLESELRISRGTMIDDLVSALTPLSRLLDDTRLNAPALREAERALRSIATIQNQETSPSSPSH